jgi:hypothetical protein
VLRDLGHSTSFLSRRTPSGLPVSSAAWYNGPAALPAGNKQRGQNQIAGPHPSPLARTDILGYRELYTALNLLSPDLVASRFIPRPIPFPGR